MSVSFKSEERARVCREFVSLNVEGGWYQRKGELRLRWFQSGDKVLLLGGSVAATVELCWPIHCFPSLAFILVCLHVREISIKGEITAVRHNGFEDVRVLAFG